MNRELTRRETVLLLILVVLVIFLGYFKLIFEPNERIVNALKRYAPRKFEARA